MNEEQRLQLQKMISTNHVEDHTPLIRQLRHSSLLKENIMQLLKIITEEGAENMDAITSRGSAECSFLFNGYTDIFNKIKKHEIDLSMLFQFIDILADIENGKMTQHEGAFAVGTILKSIYVDSALKRSTRLKEDENEKGALEIGKRTLSYSQFKKL